jgi:hypothetical protein
LVAVEDAETGEICTVDASELAVGDSPDARARRLRQAGARVSVVSTGEDAFRRLQVHFRTSRAA